MSSNHAAWIDCKNSSPLTISPAPYPPTPPPANFLIIKSQAAAINPVDWFIQSPGNPLFSYLRYPTILGSDVAGTVVSSSSPQFVPGDRVVAHAFGPDRRSNSPSEGAFQEHVLIREHLVAKIPDHVSFEQAAVLPLGFSTAATALFLKPEQGGLALPLPASPRQEPKNQVVIIWAGATSVGSNAIQMAKAAGYEVYTTASAKNWEYVRRLGATEVWDYRSESVTGDIIAKLKSENKVCAGAIAIGAGALPRCIDILGGSRTVEGQPKFVSQVSGSKDPGEFLGLGAFGMVKLVVSMIWDGLTTVIKSKVNGVRYKFVWGSDIGDERNKEVAQQVWNVYLAQAMAKGEFVPAPGPQVVEGRGLDKIQEGFEICKKGVSAAKVVVLI
ncbi:chaperonin 10-like protein [Triangularia verruculosa]|uniref:Chaperonin 10-like protein n=1 Tax=Triangularia verruculosa TaxID=2587418 RepID=A0AAN7AXS0_9PEZI|nr:chaperonin 10-like protein [Triangularia verruculosa]